MKWENTLANDMTENGLIHKQLIQLSENKPTKKGRRPEETFFLKKLYKRLIDTWKDVPLHYSSRKQK